MITNTSTSELVKDAVAKPLKETATNTHAKYWDQYLKQAAAHPKKNSITTPKKPTKPKKRATPASEPVK
jgi:hypothetical protein